MIIEHAKHPQQSVVTLMELHVYVWFNIRDVYDSVDG